MLQLHNRLSDLQRRGWVSQRECYQYRSMVQHHKSDDVTLVLRQINSRLDEIVNARNLEKNNQPSPSPVVNSFYSSSEVSNQSSSDATLNTIENSLLVANNDDDEADQGTTALPVQQSLEHLQKKYTIGKSPLAATIHKKVIKSSTESRGHIGPGKSEAMKSKYVETPTSHKLSLIMQPSELWRISHSSLTTQDLQELFVEMCFFARLGFVQPPCCLKCTYKTAMAPVGEENSPKIPSPSTQPCQAWVVWRKNANSLLHPGTICSNVVLVRCHAAKPLLNGQRVDNYQWDTTEKHLIHVPTAGMNNKVYR